MCCAALSLTCCVLQFVYATCVPYTWHAVLVMFQARCTAHALLALMPSMHREAHARGQPHQQVPAARPLWQGDSGVPASTRASSGPAEALVTAFNRHARAQRLELGFEQQLVLKLASKEAREPDGVGPFPQQQRGSTLNPHLVCAAAQAAQPAVLASTQPLAGGKPSAATQLVLSKPGAAA